MPCGRAAALTFELLRVREKERRVPPATARRREMPLATTLLAPPGSTPPWGPRVPSGSRARRAQWRRYAREVRALARTELAHGEGGDDRFLVDAYAAFIDAVRNPWFGEGARIRAAACEVPFRVPGAAVKDCRGGLARSSGFQSPTDLSSRSLASGSGRSRPRRDQTLPHAVRVMKSWKGWVISLV